MLQLKRLMILTAMGAGLLTLAPLAAFAKQPMNNASPHASMKAHNPTLAEQLHLTSNQQSDLQKLRQERMDAILKVLKNDQKNAFQQNYKTNHSLSKALAAAKVSPDQQKQIASVRQTYQQKMTAILNSDQQKKLAALTKQHKQTTALIPN